MADIVARAVLVDKMSDKLKNIRDNYEKTSKGIKKDSGVINKSFEDAKKQAKLLKASFAGFAVLGLGVFAKSIINASAEMETLETKFKVLLGSTENAKARMQELSKFAQTTPFQLTEVAGASRVLQTLGGTALATGDSLRMVGDASAISGESFENLAVHIGRAYSGLQANRPIGESMARLTELGLVTGQTRTEIEKLQQAGKGKDAWKVLQTELMKTKGGMKELSSTFGGLSSTLKDQFQTALRQIGSTGFFDNMKSGLKSLVDTMNSWIDSGVFVRIGEGWNYLKYGFKGMSQVVILGFQRIGEASIKMIKELIGGAGGLLNALPKSIVPDSWLDGMAHAEKTLDMLYKDVQSGADDMQINALDNLSKMQGAWDIVVGNIKPRIKEYKEEVKKVPEATTEMTEKQKKAYAKALQSDADFYSQLSQRMRDAEQQVTLDLMNEEDRRREELRIKQEDRINLLGETNDVILLNKKETAQLETEIEEKRLAKQQELAEKERNIQMARLSLYQTIASSISTISRNALGSSKKNAKARKGIALAEAIVNTSLGITKALSSSAPPLNLINAGVVSAQGLAQVSTIASQKFASGGIVKGSNLSDVGDRTLVRVNAGEGIFTKDQMKALGERQSINIAPNITINGNADQGAINQMNRGLQKFSDTILEAIRGGELDLVNEHNLVTQ